MTRRRALAALVLIVSVGLVVLVGQLLVPGRPAPSNPSPTRKATPAPVPAALASQAPAPTGPAPTAAHAADAAGAAAAATELARSYGDLVALGEDQAVALKRSQSASASADQLVAAMRARLAVLRRVWPVGAITYRVAPLAVRVRMDGSTAAAADVWYVGVVAPQGMPTYEEWVTQSYRLVWERGDWRIASESDAPGPRPDPGRQSPATASELDARLAGFEAAP